MDDSKVRAQSEAAYKQWAKQWRLHAKENSIFNMKSLTDFQNIGIGKAILCVANGYSFEEQIKEIKENQNNVDIICCDKTLGSLLDNGITPTYCMVCDANVNYEKYMEKWKDKLSNTILFSNVCGNPKWAKNGNWKDIYFFVNKDIINSHLEFSNISGCQNFIPAATNVSNAMVVLITQSENELRRNFFGYDKIVLTGYDYSWKFGGKYYAFDEFGDGKSNYMRHSYLVSNDGEFCYTSGNLSFSKEWLLKYIQIFNLPVVQCSKDSLLFLGKTCDISEQLKYRYKPEDRINYKTALEELKKTEARVGYLKQKLTNIGKDHYWSHIRTV